MNETNELYHHGRLHQRWGILNGPPYPLKGISNAAYKAAQAKVVGQVSSKVVNKTAKKIEGTDDEKPWFTKEEVKVILKGAAIAAGTAVLSKVLTNVSDGLVNAGKEACKKAFGKIGKQKYEPLQMDIYEKIDINDLKV